MIRNLRTGVVRAAISISLASGALCAADLDQGWPPRWRKTGPAETAVMGGLATSALMLDLLVNPPSIPRWTKPILFDQGARNALRAASEAGRSRAAIASDFGFIGLPLYAFVVEAGLVIWRGRGQADAALQLVLINAEALAITGVLTLATQRAVGRMRPNAVAGAADNTAFLSGHTSTAFTVASALCMQHSKLEVYGGGADKLVCPGALAVAAATGVLRIVSDRHWASDVLAGAALGTAVGFTVSWAHLRDQGEPAPALSVAPGGLVYGGRF
jgi:membrane-associated phospholipid phosphatase